MSNKKNNNNGAAAFPIPPEISNANSDGTVSPVGREGVSLRDWFAGMALIGLVNTNDYQGTVEERSDDDLKEFADNDSFEAYRIADAMITEREDAK